MTGMKHICLHSNVQHEKYNNLYIPHSQTSTNLHVHIFLKNNRKAVLCFIFVVVQINMMPTSLLCIYFLCNMGVFPSEKNLPPYHIYKPGKYIYGHFELEKLSYSRIWN